MGRKGYANINGENIVCPCYKAQSSTELWCESHVPEASMTVIRYRSTSALKKQIEIYCKENYKRCEHFLSVKHMKWDD